MIWMDNYTQYEPMRLIGFGVTKTYFYCDEAERECVRIVAVAIYKMRRKMQ